MTTESRGSSADLFDPVAIGALTLRNRIMRSATAEFLGDPESAAPRPELAALYRSLADGEVGLIVTGHTYVHLTGRADPEQPSMASDDVVDAWRGVIRPAQEAGARVMVQLNHSGADAAEGLGRQRVSPSGTDSDDPGAPRALTEQEIHELISAYGAAGARAVAAGFDGVQIHGPFGDLMGQFLSPGTNRREDGWSGDPDRRFAFLGAVISEVRWRVGASYPMWVKLGLAGAGQHDFAMATVGDVARRCSGLGVECLEIRHAIGDPEGTQHEAEPHYLPLARVVRGAVGPGFPLALVDGFSTLPQMQGVVRSGLVELVSLARPLICEPDLPRKLRTGVTDTAACTRCDECDPQTPGEGIGCHNEDVLAALRG